MDAHQFGEGGRGKGGEEGGGEREQVLVGYLMIQKNYCKYSEL